MQCNLGKIARALYTRLLDSQTTSQVVPTPLLTCVIQYASLQYLSICIVLLQQKLNYAYIPPDDESGITFTF